MRCIKTYIRNSGGGKNLIIFVLSLVLIMVIHRSGYYKTIMTKMGFRQEVKNEDRPDYWCIKGWTTCLQKMQVNCDVCFFGHSMIEMSDFQSYFPNKKIIELGYPGDNIKGMQMRVAQIVAVHPKKVFIMAGTNSLSYKKDIFEREYDQLIMAIKDSLPQAQLFLCNIIPQHDGKLGKSKRNSIIRERNIFIKKYTKSKHVPMIDLYTIYTNNRGELCKMYSSDGVHLVPSAYRLWVNAISTYINE